MLRLSKRREILANSKHEDPNQVKIFNGLTQNGYLSICKTVKKKVASVNPFQEITYRLV